VALQTKLQKVRSALNVFLKPTDVTPGYLNRIYGHFSKTLIGVKLMEDNGITRPRIKFQAHRGFLNLVDGGIMGAATNTRGAHRIF